MHPFLFPSRRLWSQLRPGTTWRVTIPAVALDDLLLWAYTGHIAPTLVSALQSTTGLSHSALCHAFEPFMQEDAHRWLNAQRGVAT